MKNSSIRRNDLFGASGRSNDHASACEFQRGKRNWRRYYILLGLAAISAFTLALPAAALACIAPNLCTGTTIVVNGFPVCNGGPNNGQQICSGPQSTPVSPSFANPKFGQFRDNPWPPAENFGQLMDGELGLLNLVHSGSTTNQLGMTVVPDGASNGVGFGAGGSSSRNSGVGVSDSAGLLAPGSVATGFRQNSGSGGISGTYDASSLVGPNQKLFFNGAFDYTSSNLNYASAAGSINSDMYDFRGSALYTNYQSYVALSASYGFGTNHEFFAGDLSSGDYRSDSYDVDVRFGHVFMLFNSIATSAPPPRISVKAPPRAVDGGYGVGLDLSGHVGYSSSVARGFTDSSGFVFGDETAQGGEGGLQAKFFAEVPRNGITWSPYVAGTVDWRFNYSHVANFPTQVALAGGDAVNFSDATTFVGAQAGLDVRTANGWTVGANGFYSHSSDTEIAGGRVFVKIPLGPATVVARY